jgi:polygalacturonase
MAQQRHLLPFFVFMLSFISCYSTLQKEPLRHYGEKSGFKDMIKQSSHVLSLKRIERVGTVSTSVKTVNVNDFGAKGDSTDDDTEVLLYQNNVLLYTALIIYFQLHV